MQGSVILLHWKISKDVAKHSRKDIGCNDYDFKGKRKIDRVFAIACIENKTKTSVIDSYHITFMTGIIWAMLVVDVIFILPNIK
jgi:hypothetical protein